MAKALETHENFTREEHLPGGSDRSFGLVFAVVFIAQNSEARRANEEANPAPATGAAVAPAPAPGTGVSEVLISSVRIEQGDRLEKHMFTTATMEEKKIPVADNGEFFMVPGVAGMDPPTVTNRAQTTATACPSIHQMVGTLGAGDGDCQKSGCHTPGVGQGVVYAD